ncbi:helix-turn-helix transcriptional regulator [Streptomyces sp. RKAG293]|uniref:helix-turn-helix domain-containing protein n=1 Tax=Streptomyces sp. RKAG293 TaxID=2893403 RepID=UPI002034249C|nr:helix-turn-helix transcriptional regulator [Streptomyces sp. RKAG293]MCM2417740.1 helix-turn-helix domain-containing protein [Streptomyces sp. RKAG293]
MSAERLHIAALEPYLNPVTPTPFVLKKLVGSLLQRMRLEADFTGPDVKHHLGMSTAKLCRIESGEGKRPAHESDVVALLDLYGVEDDDAAVLLALLANADRRGWWQRGNPKLLDWLDRFIDLQEGASLIRTFELMLVPGLLQTESYAEAVIRRGRRPTSESEILRAVRLRMQRQELLVRPGGATLWAVIDESVLYRNYGGAQVMAEQLQRLLALSELSENASRVRLQIIPQCPPEAVAPGMAFTYLRFPHQDLADVAYTELPKGGVFEEDPEHTADYRMQLDLLSQIALTPADTRALLRATIRERYS